MWSNIKIYFEWEEAWGYKLAFLHGDQNQISPQWKSQPLGVHNRPLSLASARCEFSVRLAVQKRLNMATEWQGSIGS